MHVLHVTSLASAVYANSSIAALSRLCQTRSGPDVFYAMHVTADVMSYELLTHNGCIAGDKQLCLYVSAHPLDVHRHGAVGRCALVLSFKNTAERRVVDVVSQFFNIIQRNMTGRMQQWLANCAEARLRNSCDDDADGDDESGAVIYDTIVIAAPQSFVGSVDSHIPSAFTVDVDSPMPSMIGSGFGSDYDNPNSLYEDSCDTNSLGTDNSANEFVVGLLFHPHDNEMLISKNEFQQTLARQNTFTCFGTQDWFKSLRSPPLHNNNMLSNASN